MSTLAGWNIDAALENQGNWPAVQDAIRERMAQLRMSTAMLARETGLSETTIRYIGEPGRRHNRSSLVAISAVLGWRYDHLTNILRGEPSKSVPVKLPEIMSRMDAKINHVIRLIEQLADTSKSLQLIRSLAELPNCRHSLVLLKAVAKSLYPYGEAGGIDIPGQRVDCPRANRACLFRFSCPSVDIGQCDQYGNSVTVKTRKSFGPQRHFKMLTSSRVILQVQEALPDLLIEACLVHPVCPARLAGFWG